jgi:beta-lactamase regulating signal transducer with metallopeptidase domain
MSTAIITSWLLTYLAHSTVLLGAALVAVRFLGDKRFALQEILLRAALIGGLLTATLQFGLGVEPVGGAFALQHLSVTENPAPQVVASTVASMEAVEVSPAATIRTRVEAIWPLVLLCLWGAGALVALTGLGRSILDLRRLLKTRRFRPTGGLLDRLAVVMGLRRPVRLSTSAAIAVPFAIGIRQPEICCPERVSDLAAEHQRGLFAHELAHLARRDPAWQLLYRLGEALLFLQPLNRLVRRRLEEIAEHLTDERAIGCTGDRLGLARTLVVVAHWGVSNPPGLPATALAAGPRLDRRVRHLISGNLGGRGNPKWTIAAAIALLLGSVVLLPAVTPASAHADVSYEAIHTASTTTWSGAEDAPAPPKPPEPEAAPAPEIEGKSPVTPKPASAPAAAMVAAPPAAPAPEMEPQPVNAPAAPVESEAPVESAPPAVPVPSVKTVPAPAVPAPSLKNAEPTPAVTPDRVSRERSREAARERQRAEHRERANAEARARERAREVEAEARELEREAAERSRRTDAERQTLRNEARELVRRAEREVRELAQRARERSRITDAEREELRRRAETLRVTQMERAREASREAREQARALAERARRLAEEAEAERRAEEKREQ